MKLKISLLIVMIVMLSGVAAFAGENAVRVVETADHVKRLTDAEDVTLYWYKQDSPGVSACYGGCVKNWPVFYREEVTPTGDLKAEDFGTITRDDGQKQTTFRGYPLYYYVGDKGPTVSNGHGIGGVWFTIDPDNFPVE